jgi:hypothetical protein
MDKAGVATAFLSGTTSMSPDGKDEAVRQARIVKGGNSGSAAVLPGQSAGSPILDYVSGRVGGMEMPPLSKRDKFAALSKEEVELMWAWIEQGVAWPAGAVLNSKRK